MFFVHEILRILRVQQYGKQIFVLLPCVALGEEIELEDLSNSFLAFVSFCFLASTIYIVNDIYDIDQDRVHPYKSTRPLAMGTIKLGQGIVIGLVTIFASLGVTLFISQSLLPLYFIMLAYILINILYSRFQLKKQNLLGVITVAMGFPIRFTFGTLAIGQQFSYWAFSLCFTLAVFLLTGKRIQQQHLGDTVTANLAEQGKLFLFGGLLLAVYIAFTLQPSTQLAWGDSLLYLTPLPVALFVARYLEIVFESDFTLNADVTETFYRDLFIFATCFVFVFLMFIAKIQD